MAGHLNWTLKQIFLAQGDLNRTLADWFERSEHLRMAYGLVDRIYPDVKTFDNPEHKWQGTIARKLYAVYHLARGAASRMHEDGGFDKFKTWRFLNCRPYGGNWTSEYNAEKSAGKQCRSLLCPWCYLRRYDALRTLLKAPVTQEVRFPAGNVASSPGLAIPISVTSFDAYGDLKSAQHQHVGIGKPEVLLEQERLDPFSRAVQNDTKRRLNLAVKHRLEDVTGDRTTVAKVPEFLVAVSTLGPVVRQSDGKVGIRTAYLHNSNPPVGRTEFKLMGDDHAISGVIEMRRAAGLSAESALLLVQPYPWELLDKPPAVQREVLTGLAGRGTYAFHRGHLP
jgi:hypothetical protein